MNLLLGALAEGFLFTALALGLYVSWRIYEILDLTVDGAFTLGGAACAALLVKNVNPLLATALGGLAGSLAGIITGLLCTQLRINASLAGVLVSTGFYSITLVILGGGTLSLADASSVMTGAGTLGQKLGLPESFELMGTTVSAESVVTVFVMAGLAVFLTALLILFLRTDLGLAVRASGGNPSMARAIGVNVDHMLILGLALANGLVAISGALEAQFVGYSNVQMGVGAVVTGLATLLIGEALMGRRPLWRWVGSALVGAVVYRALIAAAVRAGLNANALRLLTAVMVLVVLLLPRLRLRFRKKQPGEGAEYA
jgi:putative tryptophan/tyrosine transport system permease protein